MYGMEYYRKLLGMTGSEFAQIVHASKSQISYWEKGKRPINDFKKGEMRRIFGEVANLFDVEISSEETADLLRKSATLYLSSYNREPNNVKSTVQDRMSDLKYTSIAKEISRITDHITQYPELIKYYDMVYKLYLQDKNFNSKRLELVLYGALPTSSKSSLHDLEMIKKIENSDDPRKYDKIRSIRALLEIVHNAMALTDQVFIYN